MFKNRVEIVFSGKNQSTDGAQGKRCPVRAKISFSDHGQLSRRARATARATMVMHPWRTVIRRKRSGRPWRALLRRARVVARKLAMGASDSPSTIKRTFILRPRKRWPGSGLSPPCTWSAHTMFITGCVEQADTEPVEPRTSPVGPSAYCPACGTIPPPKNEILLFHDC